MSEVAGGWKVVGEIYAHLVEGDIGKRWSEGYNWKLENSMLIFLGCKLT